MKFLRTALILALLVISSQTADAEILHSWKHESKPAAPAAAPRQLQVDQNLVAAAFPPPQATAETREVVGTPDTPSENHRLLAPPKRRPIEAPTSVRPASTPRSPTMGLPKIESFATASAGLAIVVGLFLVCMWLLRRSGPKPTSPLPSEAVAVLGRVPLAARNFAHLLQVGNKLVLVAITPEGVAPITEVNDPAEVQRLLGLCLRNQKQSTTAEFHNVLQQLSEEPTSGFLGNEVAATYASQVGKLRT